MVKKKNINKNVLIWHWGRRGGGPKYTLELSRELLKFNDFNLHISISRQSELLDKFEDLNLKYHLVDTYHDLKSGIINSFKIADIRKKFWCYVEKNKIDIIISIFL